MQNRFGLKDFVLLIVVGVVGLLVILGMFQADRGWEKLSTVESKLSELEQILTSGDSNSAELDALREELVSLKKAIAAQPTHVHAPGETVAVTSSDRGTPQPSTETDSGATASSEDRDTSWARPGVEIAWQEPWTFANSPEDVPGFRRGGEFTDIFGAQPARITPIIAGDVYSRRVLDQCVQSLAAHDPITLKTRGMLADAWQYDPNGLWLRVHINPKARFSDGHPVTSEDVHYTFMDFIMNPLIEAERSRATLDMIENVKIIDEQTVEFEFNKFVFTNLDYPMGAPILAKHYYGKFEPAQINQSTGLLFGSGMFRLANIGIDNQWAPGSDIVVVRNERYWGPEKPALASMRYKIVSQDLARLVAFRNGEGDMMTPTSPQYGEFQDDDEFLEENDIYKWLNMRSGYSFIGWQCGNRNNVEGQLTPFHDTNVRRAMTMILDRPKMIRDIWDGVGIPATGPNSPASPASNPDVEPWSYDPEKADELFAGAGWADADGDGIREYQRDDGIFGKGEKFEFEFTITASGQSAERVVKYLQNQCRRNGIVCTPRLVDWSFYSQMLKTRDFDAMIMGWSANSPESDPRQIWHSTSILDQADNFIQWHNEEADALIDEGRVTMDTESRMKIWHDLHSVIHDDQPYTFLRVVPWIRFIKNDIGNVHMYPAALDRAEFFRAASSQPAP